MIAAPSGPSSSRMIGRRRCVERGCPITAHARRSETGSLERTCSTQSRRREGLSIRATQPWGCPLKPPSGSAGRASVQTVSCAGARSPAPGPSAAWPGRVSSRRSPAATGNSSVPRCSNVLQTMPTVYPWLIRTSASRSIPIICSVEKRFCAISLLPRKGLEIAGFA